ncbi:MAG TPA: ribonuclease HI [Lachnospiraceae bacterium]|nr:ribonuclease HI [uncultured Lachnoclostridium sp.]HAU85131.1 ribonuclease HI [Lachnospiraceae bacterium]
MKEVIIYTDGGCRGNQSKENVGAYGIVMMYTDPKGTLHKKEVSCGFRNVTNNQMELKAVVEALRLLNYPCQVQLYSDSRYVCDAINKKWLSGWIAKGWITSSNKPVKNQELWVELLAELGKHKVTFHWVKGHNNNEGNERCDQLCNLEMDLLTGGK